MNAYIEQVAADKNIVLADSSFRVYKDDVDDPKLMTRMMKKKMSIHIMMSGSKLSRMSILNLWRSRMKSWNN